AAAAQTQPVQAQEAIPDYFFKAWTVNRDCTEAHSGGLGHTIPGLKFKPTRNANGTFSLQAVNTAAGRWARGWQNVKLEYRAGTRMASIPADMASVPGTQRASPFLPR